jgi:hypothetical protein
MKKLTWALSLAVILTFTCQLMAQHGEDYGIHPGKKGAWELGKGKDEWGTFSALKDASLSFDIAKNATTAGFDYGTFKYDSVNKQIVAGSEEFAGSVDPGVTGGGKISIGYNAGDMVGVWVEIEGETYYSIPSLNSDFYTKTDHNSPPTGYANVWFGSFENPNDVNSTIKLSLTGTATPASSGAPLPGVLATMLLSGGVGGYLRKRSKAAERVEQ